MQIFTSCCVPTSPTLIVQDEFQPTFKINKHQYRCQLLGFSLRDDYQLPCCKGSAPILKLTASCNCLASDSLNHNRACRHEQFKPHYTPLQCQEAIFNCCQQNMLLKLCWRLERWEGRMARPKCHLCLFLGRTWDCRFLVSHQEMRSS